jgi:D-amino peptidase
MKKVLLVLSLLLFVVCMPDTGEDTDGLRVFIGTDMEGITGVFADSECGSEGPDYNYFRKIMTEETNTAIEAALVAGAVEIVVCDGHGDALNLIPDLLNENALLVRGHSTAPGDMVEGIDESFDALIFIGYHAKSGTFNGVLAHTMSGNVIDLSMNGVSLPEAGINALVAGRYDVPVIFLSGDVAICEQAKGLFGDIETVAVKEGLQGASAVITKHPEVAKREIYEGVLRAFNRLDTFKPYKLDAPFTMNLKLEEEPKEIYPGMKKIGDKEYTFTHNDIMEVLKAFEAMR